MFCSKYSLHNNNPVVYCKDDVGDLIDGGVDIVKDDIIDPIGDLGTDIYHTGEDAYHDTVDYLEDDLLDDIGDIGTNAYHSVEDAVSDIYDTVNDAIYDIETFTFRTVDFVMDKGLGISGSTKFLRNLSTGVHAILRGIGDGNWQAIKMGIMIAVLVVVTILSWGAASPYLAAALAYGVPTAGAALLVTLAVISVASSIYSIYGMAVSIADIGEAIRNGSTAGVIKAAMESKAQMDLAFVNGWINGSMNMWMAGGILYDSPRAGDVLFNVTGSQKTTKFLNIQGSNSNNWQAWDIGRYHDYQKKVFGNLAGSDFFAVSPLAQRI